MVDFSKMTKATSGQAPKPKALPPGNYPGVVARQEYVEAPPGKDYTTICRFHLKMLDWPEGTAEEDKLDQEGKPVDLSKKQLRRDFYDSQMYRLDQFLESLNLEGYGTEDYESIIPKATGSRVMVEVQQYLNKSNEIMNQVGNLVGEQS